MLGTAENRRIINILCCGGLLFDSKLTLSFKCFRLARIVSVQTRGKKRKSAKQIIQILFYSALIRESVPATVISTVQQPGQHSCPNPHQKGEDMRSFRS